MNLEAFNWNNHVKNCFVWSSRHVLNGWWHAGDFDNLYREHVFFKSPFFHPKKQQPRKQVAVDFHQVYIPLKPAIQLPYKMVLSYVFQDAFLMKWMDVSMVISKHWN